MDICNFTIYAVLAATAIHFTGHVASRIYDIWKATATATAPKATAPVPAEIQETVEALFDETETETETEPAIEPINLEYTPIQVDANPIAIANTLNITTAVQYAAKATTTAITLVVPVEPDYSGLSVAELRQECQKQGIKYRKQVQGKRRYLTKAEMLAALAAEG